MMSPFATKATAPPRRQEHVVRLQVPVQDPLLVRLFERVERLHDDAAGPPVVQRTFPRNDHGERLPLEQLHFMGRFYY
jgi:hypothetical protein